MEHAAWHVVCLTTRSQVLLGIQDEVAYLVIYCFILVCQNVQDFLEYITYFMLNV